MTDCTCPFDGCDPCEYCRASITAPAQRPTHRQALETIARVTFSGSEMSDDYVRGNRDAHAFIASMARDVLAAPSSPAADSAWQDIETAPNHGEVLLWWKHAGVGVGSWDDEGNGWRCEGDDCVPKNQSDCTHWMPKPAGPSISSTSRATPEIKGRTGEPVYCTIDGADWCNAVADKARCSDCPAMPPAHRQGEAS